MVAWNVEFATTFSRFSPHSFGTSSPPTVSSRFLLGSGKAHAQSSEVPVQVFLISSLPLEKIDEIVAEGHDYVPCHILKAFKFN